MLKPFLLGGIIVMRNKSLIYGVGVNDSATPTYRSKTILGKRIVVWRCTIYSIWTGIIERCYSDAFQLRNPTYTECSMVDEWLRFSIFRVWMQSKKWESMHIDKDILLPGNKIYGPDQCAFITRSLNNFIIDSGASRGDWPLGVSFKKSHGKFVGNCNNPFTGKLEGLGYFSNSFDAHEAWRRRKHEHALRYADMQEDERLAQALRIRYLPENLHKIGI